MDKLRELKEKRASLIEQQKAINDASVAENRNFTAEETEKYEKIEVDFVAVTAEIKEETQAQELRQKHIEDLAKKSELLKDKGVKHENAKANDPGTDENRAFAKYLLGGIRNLNDMEMRALQADLDTAGGFLVAPEQFVTTLIKTLDNLTFIRGMATVYQVPNAASLGAPALDNDIGDATWTAEIKTGSNDTTMSFDKRALYPHPLARRIKVSEKLLRQSLMNVAGIVNDRMAYKFSVVEENAFLNGTGANQPLGIFTASALGISPSRDVSTNNTITAIKADNLMECKYTLPAQYRRNCSWIFHRDAIKMIRKLKDGEGQYLWQQGITAGAPDTILGFPVKESEYAPNTFTTGLYVGCLGDFSFYWIADALNMQVKVLNELYAETGQIGYIGRKETDGMPVLEEAFVRVTLA